MANYLIIGGSSGIGKSLVELLEKEGHQVFATYFKNKLENRQNVNYQYYDVVNDQPNFTNLPEQINGLVYCPGSINLKPFKRFSEDDFIEDFKLQVLGATKTIRTLMPKLNASESNSSIVLFSTVAVQRGFNFHSQVSISKGAIEGLTKSLAAEFAPKIRVNAIAPALTNTPLANKLLGNEQKINFHAEKNPLKKVGAANDIANAAAFLLQPKSNWITGQIIAVDGGYSTLLQ